MAVIANLAIGLSANSARLSKDLGKARKRTKRFTKGVSSDFKRLAGTIAASLSIGAFKSFIDNIDALAKSAESVGLSFKDFQLLSGAFQELGIESSVLQKSIINVEKAIGEAALGTKTYTDALGLLGLSYESVAELSPEDRFLAIIDALKGIEDPTLRALAGNRLLGRAYKDIGPALNAGSKGIQQLAKDADRLGTVLSTNTSLAAQAFNDETLILGKQLQVLVAEAITPFLESLVESIKSMQEFIAENRNTIVAVVDLAGSVGKVVAVVYALRKAVLLATVAVTFLNKAIRRNPLGFIASAATAAAASFLVFADDLEAINKALDDDAGYMKTADGLGMVEEAAKSAAVAVTALDKELVQINDDAQSLLDELADDEVKRFDSLRDGIGRSVSEGIISGFKDDGVAGAFKGFALAFAAELENRAASALTDVLFGAKGGNGSSAGLIGGLVDGALNFFSGANTGGFVTNDGIMRFNSGGVVPGIGNRDTVPALLTPGEIVTNPARGQTIGETFNVNITSTDARSFEALLARNPKVLSQIAEVGRQATTGIR